MATYKIVSQFHGLALDVPGFSTDDGKQIQQWADNGAANQHWELVPVSLPWTAPPPTVGDFLFKIVSQSSGKVLEVPFDQLQNNGAKIQQYTDNGGVNQHWRLTLVDADGITFVITSMGSGKVLDVPAFSTKTGELIQQWDYLGRTNQHWQLIRIS